MKTVIMDIMKRSFTELSKESQIILGIIITIITIWEISAFLNMIERKRRWYLLSLAVGILIFSTILMQGLADLARGGHMTESVPGRILEKIPFSYGVLLLALLYGVEYLLWKKEKNTPEYLTARSVKETLDARMDGICYASMEGQPILVNRQMNEICGYLVQTEIMNANDFWEDLQNIQTSEKAEVIRNEPSLILRFSDTKVWNFLKKEVSMKDTSYQEIIAYDIAEQYQLNRELKDRNTKLNDINRRLMKFNEEVETVTRQKEMLEAKMKVHDDLGRVLLALRTYLEEPENSKRRKELLAMWKYVVNSMTYEAGEKENKKSFEELKKIADLMDVEIIFEGELPQTEKEQRVIYALLRESLNNMIKHAGGHYLYIEIDNSGEDVQICLHNDGEIPKQKIEEKGGLRNLRMMVESIDGEFRIESFPIFAIYVTLKKEKVWRK